MKDDVFEDILRCVRLPLGVLLRDRSTYRITSDDFPNIQTRHAQELDDFEKFLVLTNGQGIVVGGILFYGDTDIQATVFPEYRGKHFMSRIHKNGILKSECYPNQKVSVSTNTIESFADFQKKHYLLSRAGLKVENISKIYRHCNAFKLSDRFREIQKYTEEEFIKAFS